MLRVQDRAPEAAEIEQRAAVCRALMGGTDAMRAAGRMYLPAWPGEDPAAHGARLMCATLFPAFRRTVSVMAAKPFSKPITIGEDVPAGLRPLLQNVDLQGRDLHAFAADAFLHAVAYGTAGIIVDYPKVPPARTIEDERRSGARPYAVLIPHWRILGWQTEIFNGAPRLTQLRLTEDGVTPDGPYGSAVRQRVRVYYPGRFELYEQNVDQTKPFDLIDEGPTPGMDEIPFVPLYGFREGFMCGRPPLLDLAHLNVKHWQSQSDQDNILHVARIPILCVTGIDDPNFKMVVGAGAAIKLPTGSTMQYVEHSGSAIAAGQASIDALERQMIQSGAELLVKQPGERSATEAASDAEANKCDLQRIALVFQDCLAMMLQFFAKWSGLPEGGHVMLFNDYGAASLGQASGQLVLSMQQSGLIGKATAIREMQRRGELDSGLEAEEVLAEVDAEGPPLGLMAEPVAPHQTDDDVDDESATG